MLNEAGVEAVDRDRVQLAVISVAGGQAGNVFFITRMWSVLEHV
jgi:hypothetical protein